MFRRCNDYFDDDDADDDDDDDNGDDDDHVYKQRQTVVQHGSQAELNLES